MRLAIALIIIGVVIGYLAGGRLRGLLSVRIRWPLLAVVGLLLQEFHPPSSLEAMAFPLFMLSFALLTVFAGANIRVPGFPVLLAGLTLNAIVIGINGGMPIPERVLIAAGESGAIPALRAGGSLYHLAGPQDRLLAFADSIGGRYPVHFVLSIGDLFLFAGMMVVLVWGMRSALPVSTEAMALEMKPDR